MLWQNESWNRTLGIKDVFFLPCVMESVSNVVKIFPQERLQSGSVEHASVAPCSSSTITRLRSSSCYRSHEERTLRAVGAVVERLVAIQKKLCVSQGAKKKRPCHSAYLLVAVGLNVAVLKTQCALSVPRECA